MSNIKQIIIRLPDEIHQKLKIKVLREGTSIQEVLSRYVEKYLDNNESDDLIEEILCVSTSLKRIRDGVSDAEVHFEKLLNEFNYNVINSENVQEKK